MKTLYASLFTLLIIMLGLSTEQAEAQCVACYQTVDDCKTEVVNADGYDACGCKSGCECSGACTYDDGGGDDEIKVAFHSGKDLNNMSIPDGGYKIRIDEDLFNDAFATFVKGGKIEDDEIDQVWFGDKVALYELSNEEYLIFPLKEDGFDLRDCNGEIMAVITKN